MTTNERMLAELGEMLTYGRPDGSRAERRFVRRYVAATGAKPDGYGNHILRIGDAPVLWSCHTDSVHRKPGRFPVELSTAGYFALAPRSGASCLGADDAAGVWLMLEMIRAKRPGLYVFHRGEEAGGLGSRWIARNTPELLDGIDFAVALDRRGTGSVITHQFTRCCSDDFGRSLASELSANAGLFYMLDDGGTFTDTASYTSLVAECTNVSVGYYQEHTINETLDADHVLALRSALLDLDVSRLVVSRDPSAPDDDDYASWLDRYPATNGNRSSGSFGNVVPLDRSWKSESRSGRRLADLCRDNPDFAASLLEDLGYSARDFSDALDAAYGGSYLAEDDDSQPSWRGHLFVTP